MSDEARFQKAIQQLNEVREQKGVDYNGKLYSTVKDRVEEFRKLFGSEFGIDTVVDYRDGFGHGSVVVANAKIVDKATGTILASGHAMNHFGSDSVNTTSIVEVTETNAIGRALATFGLHGGEFASAGEMTILPAKEAAAKQSTGTTKNDSSKYEKLPPKEREFREAVDEAFPPKINQYEFYIPMDNSQDEMDKAFAEIDRIENDKELYAYYHALQRGYFDLLSKGEIEEFTQSFKSRKNQLKG